MPKPPVASFDARLLELFRRAAAEPLHLLVPSHREAHRLRFRLHALRKAMRREQHPMLALAEAVTIRLIQHEKTATILAGPADSDLATVLDAAGLVVDADAQAESEKIEPMDEFLSKLVHREKET